MSMSSCSCGCLFLAALGAILAALAAVVLGLWMFFAPESRTDGLNHAEGFWAQTKEKVDHFFSDVRSTEKNLPSIRNVTLSAPSVPDVKTPVVKARKKAGKVVEKIEDKIEKVID